MTSRRSGIRRMRACRLRRAWVLVLFSLLPVAHVLPTAANQDQVHERAVAEVMPGVFIRTQAGNVVINTGDQTCDPACLPGSVCESTCREAACPPGANPLSRCLRCGWDCVW
jgi:hypothetical protein